jgi:hypothetical protein
MSLKFPQVPGHYFWFNLDLSFFEIGSVHVLKDSEKHLAYLRVQPRLRESCWSGVFYPAPYIYQNDAGETLTMYWDANGGQNPHLPFLFEPDNRPNVDGFIPFDFKELLDKQLK